MAACIPARHELNQQKRRWQMQYRINVASALALTALLVGACESKNDPMGPNSQAQVQFANVSNLPGLNFTAGGQAMAQNVGFGTPTTQCVRLNSGNTAFGATATGTNTAFGANINQNLTAGGRYTVLAAGTAAAPRYIFLDDATTAAPSGQGRLRIVHAAPGLTTGQDVHVTAVGAPLGTATASNTMYGGTTSWVNVPTGQTQIRLTATGTQNVGWTSETFNVTAGENRTIVIAPGTTAGTYRIVNLQACP
jgi:hypothetical protein